MRVDPVYGPITRRWLEHPEELNEAFAKAWYKLLHRDMGPISRYLGPWIPEPQLWQDPVPDVDHPLVDEQDIATLKGKVLESGLSVAAAGEDGLVRGFELPGHRQARWCQRRTATPAAATQLGGQRTVRAGQGASGAGAGPAGLQCLRIRWQEDLAGRPHRPGRLRRDREGRSRRRIRGQSALRPGRTDASQGADRRRVVRGARTTGRWVPQLRTAG